MLRRAQTNRTQCLVHQFLESQRRTRQQAHHRYPPAIDEHEHEHEHGRHHEHGHHHDLDSKPRPQSQPPAPSSSHAVDATTELGLDRVPDIKGSSESSPSSRSRDDASSRGIPKVKVVAVGEEEEDPETEGEIGQPDEKAWTSDIAAPRSSRGDAAAKQSLEEMDEEDELRSRMLTKKQLSEMAWGVRELSRRLGSVRLKFRARSIFLLTKIYDEDLIPKTRELAAWLLGPERKVRYVVYVQRELRDNKKFDARGLVEDLNKRYAEGGGEEGETDVGRRLRCWDENMCHTRPHTFDFVITLGGDGTVLYASWLFQRIVPPVLSFSLGSLGFLTKFDFEGYQQTLTTAFQAGVTVSLRLRFECTIMRSRRKKVEGAVKPTAEEQEERQKRRDLVEELVGEEQEDEHTHRPDGTYEILNEIVVDRGPNPSKSFTSSVLNYA